MPEIAEVFRAADYIRQHLVGRTLASVTALHDENIFGKVGTSAAEIEKSITGKKIVGAGQQGKYFWIAMASPPHLLCHFGMNGWFHIKGIPTFYYKDTKKDKLADKEWPPRHWKILFETKPEGKDKTVMQAAFVDSRRFARVRLIDVPIEDIRQHTPLKENGPDPNTDKAVVTRDWLAALCNKRKAPIKAVLLNQANISGIGNWVGDEVLYQARIHPEQYSNTLSEEQISELYKQLMEVVRIAIETKSDSDLFPKTWLFKHRWGKGRKAVYEMPNGDEITYCTVGGRTSAIVPALQIKTGPVAGDVEDEKEVDPEIETELPKKKGKRKQADATAEEEEAGPILTPAKRRRTARTKSKADNDENDLEEDETQEAKPAKRATKGKADVKRITKAAASNKYQHSEDETAKELPPTATAEEVAEDENATPDSKPKSARKSRRSRAEEATMIQAGMAEQTLQTVNGTAVKGRSKIRASKDKVPIEAKEPATDVQEMTKGKAAQKTIRKPVEEGRRRSGRLRGS